jgi:hypothetical protein
MPRSRETPISATTRLAAKYKFQGSATSTISQPSASAPAAIDSTVLMGTPEIRASQAISSPAAAPTTSTAHHLIRARPLCTSFMPRA